MSASTSKFAQRLFRLVEALAGNELEGCRPTDLADSLDASLPSISRDLGNLQNAGWAEKIEPSGRWRLTSHVARISTTIHANLQRMRARLDETERNYSRTL